MQQRPQTVRLQLGLVLHQDAAIHPEKVQAHLKGTTQKSGRKFRLNQQDAEHTLFLLKIWISPVLYCSGPCR